MNKKIFLSYSIEDKDLAESFKEQVNNFKKIDFLEYLQFENNDLIWKEKVDKLIYSSELLLCLFGFSTWESEAVKWEIEKAIEHNKPVIIVKLKSTVFMIPNYIIENHLNVFEYDPKEIVNYIDSKL